MHVLKNQPKEEVVFHFYTKAMHLTEADVNPIFIRDFLGKDVIPERPNKDWTEDKSLLDWLNGLKH